MAATLRQYLQLVRHFGPAWVSFRAYYAALQRGGLLQVRLPTRDWNEQPLRAFVQDATLADPHRYAAHRSTASRAFFFHSGQQPEYARVLSQFDSQDSHPRQVTDDLDAGVLRFFEHLPVNTGNPPAWNCNSMTGEELPNDCHWSEIRDFGSGDIKVVWEPNRFAFVYALVRMYWRTGDDRFAEMFWQLVEDWQRHNPPQSGPNWKCGQEVALRVMAWCFGLYGFMSSPATSARRIALLAQMMAVSGNRIFGNLSYALSQKNNHGISEATGLWTIGLLFPEFRAANQWKQTGRRLLERLAKQLVYDDGGFSQHSLNYHRVMLHDYLWSLRLGELHDDRFSSELYDRIGRAGNLLFQLQDEQSGQVPCYGQNDGALALPLSNCDPRDFRPVVQATAHLTRQTREYEPGPWDEDLLWLFGPQASDAPHDPNQLQPKQQDSSQPQPSQRKDLVATESGYFVLRRPTGFAFVRAATFRHRPSQADCLHTDIWWRGQNIALDAGTYSYNAPKPWDNPFARSEFHNTVTVDGHDQMDRAGRFLWLPWLSGHGSQIQTSPERLAAYWEGHHNGYRRLADPVTHRRGIVRLGEEHWLVVDLLQGRRAHSYCLHWLLSDFPYDFDSGTGRLTLDTPAGSYGISVATPDGAPSRSLVRAASEGSRGWRASHYMKREPALSLRNEMDGAQCWFFTLLGPDPSTLRVQEEQLDVSTDAWTAVIHLNANAATATAMVKSVEVAGESSDHLEVMPCESF